LSNTKNKVKKILIFGSSGQLGSIIFKKIISNKNFKSLNKKKFKIDFLNINNLKFFLKIKKPDLIINCAAFTNVDLAEKKKLEAMKVNATALKTISQYCSVNGTILIHFSTDYVFNSKIKKNFYEKDKPNPINYYGYTKYVGEKYIKKYMKKYFIFRISWVYSKNKNNFYYKIKKKILNSQITKIHVVNDQFGSPLSTNYVADIICKNLKKIANKKIPFGIYHISSKNYCSWYSFAKYINFKLNKKNKIFPIDTSDLNLKAKRPNFSILKFSKFKFLVKKKKTWQEIYNNFLIVKKI
jgi:dTDP-4-dehydrorhamnose reductase